MKRIIKIKYTWALPLLLLFVAACSDDAMDRISKDLNHTTDVSARLILTDVMTGTGFTAVGGDMNGYLSIYIEHETGVHNQFWNAELRNGEPSSSSTFNNLWGGIYSRMRDTKDAIEKCSEGGDEEGNYVTLGIAQVLLAYNIVFMTDMFGDVPWTEAGDFKNYRYPNVDKQEKIYSDAIDLLDAAIANLNKEDALIGIGNQDIIYGGNANKWLKTAYGLKARYTMHLLHRSSSVNTDLQNILDYISRSFTSADEQFSLDIYSGTNLNPMFAIFLARQSLSASQSLYNKLAQRDDPRLYRCYIDPRDEIFQMPGEIELAPHGTVSQGQLQYSNSVFVAFQSAPTHMLSYHELLFLKAEAEARLGVSSAKATLKEAVVAGLANAERNVKAALESTYWDITGSSDEITTSVAENYFDTKVSPLYDANPLKEVMIQKYLAFWGANGESVETYNDVRRLKAMGNNVYELENPLPFPLRCPYGIGDTSANPNISALYGNGQYVYSENVWWAGGSR